MISIYILNICNFIIIINYYFTIVDEFVIRTLCGSTVGGNAVNASEQVVAVVGNQSPENGQNLHHPCEDAQDTYFDGWGG